MHFPPENIGPSMEYSLFHEVYNLDAIQDLLINNPQLLNCRDEKSGWTLLMNSVVNNDFEIVNYLLKAGADPDVSNIYDETPLYHAVENKNYKIINCLLENGANTNLQQQDGDTPLHLAVVKNDYKIVKLLLLYKADPTLTTFESGQTPLDLACEKGQTKIMDILATKMKEMGYFNNQSGLQSEHYEENPHETSNLSTNMKATSQFHTPEENNYSTFNPQNRNYEGGITTPHPLLNESFRSQKNQNYPLQQNSLPISQNDSTNVSNLSISTTKKNLNSMNAPTPIQVTSTKTNNIFINIGNDLESKPLQKDIMKIEEKLYSLQNKLMQDQKINSNDSLNLGRSIGDKPLAATARTNNNQIKSDIIKQGNQNSSYNVNSSFSSLRNQGIMKKDDIETEERYLGNTNSSIDHPQIITQNDRIQTNPYLNINFSQDNFASKNNSTAKDRLPTNSYMNDPKSSYNQPNKFTGNSSSVQPPDLFSPIRNTDGQGFISNTIGSYKGVGYTPGSQYKNNNSHYINDSIPEDTYQETRVPSQPPYQPYFNNQQQFHSRDLRNTQNYRPGLMNNDHQNYSMYNYQNSVNQSYINSPQYNQMDMNRSYQNQNYPNSYNNQGNYMNDRVSQNCTGNQNFNPTNKKLIQSLNTSYHQTPVNLNDNQLLSSTKRSTNNHIYSNQSQGRLIMENDSSFKQNTSLHSGNPSSTSINAKQAYPSNSRASNKINHAAGNSIYSQGRREEDSIGAEISRITLKNNTLQDSTLDYNFPLQQTGKVGNFESMKSESSVKVYNTKILSFKYSFQRRNSFTLRPKVRYAEPFYDDTADLARFVSTTNDIEINIIQTCQSHSRKASSIYYEEDCGDHFTYGNNQTQSNVVNTTTHQNTSKLQNKKEDTFGFSQTSKSFKNDLIRKDTKEIQESVISEKVYIDKMGSMHQLEEKLELDQPHHKELYEFLCSISLGKYIQHFLKNGFDDIGQLVEQMGRSSKEPLTDQNLVDIGIKLPGHRARVLIKLEEISKNFDFELPKGLYYNLTEEFAITSEANYDQHVKYVENWLQQMKLNDFLPNFLKAGYYCLELMLIQMLSRNPITDKILEADVKIDKIGYRGRLLNKLKQGKKLILYNY